MEDETAKNEIIMMEVPNAEDNQAETVGNGDPLPTSNRTAKGDGDDDDHKDPPNDVSVVVASVVATKRDEEGSAGGRSEIRQGGTVSVLSYRQHARAVSALTVPIILSQFFQNTMPIIDIAFVGNLGKNELAAAALATVWFNLWNAFMLGFMTVIDTWLAQSYGAQDFHAFGIWTGISLVIIPACTVILSGLVALCGPVMKLFGQDHEIADEAGQFAFRLIPGLFPYYLFNVVLKFLQTQDRLVPGVVIGVLANGLNIFFNWLLIYEAGMGLQGAPWATSLTRFLQFAMIMTYVVWNKRSFQRTIKTTAVCTATTVMTTKKNKGCSKAGESIPNPTTHGDDDDDDLAVDADDADDDGGTVTVSTWPQFDRTYMTRAVLGPFWKLAISGGLSFSAETWSFEVTTILAAQLGTTQLDAHVITLTLATFIYLSFPFAIGVAASIRVGQLTGDQRPVDAKRSYITSTGMSALMQGTLIAVVWPCRNVIGQWFSVDDDVADLVADLIPISCVFMMADAVQATIGGVLRGLGRQRMVLFLNILAYWVLAVPIGAVLTFPIGLGVQGLWWGFTIGLYISALVSFLFVRYQIDWGEEAKEALRRISTVSSPQCDVPSKSLPQELCEEDDGGLTASVALSPVQERDETVGVASTV